MANSSITVEQKKEKNEAGSDDSLSLLLYGPCKSGSGYSFIFGEEN